MSSTAIIRLVLVIWIALVALSCAPSNQSSASTPTQASPSPIVFNHVTTGPPLTPAQRKEQELRTKRKDALTKQYEKLCHIGYLYQIEERLQREDFQMDHSGFEKAPDGSKGVRRYFSKRMSDGFVIKVWLQSGYSLSAYYCEVEVEPPG